MRVLVISDVHGNWPALNAVLEREAPFDLCLNIGDLVDYGPFPKECVRWAMTTCPNSSVRGNHDHGVAQGVQVTGDHGYRFLTKVTRPSMWKALDGDERRFLLQLPLTHRLTIEGKRFLLVHGTPRDPLDEYVMRDVAAWAKRVEGSEADMVCVGHTHMQFNILAGRTVVLNPGSTGQPRDGDPRAAYAVIEGQKVELKRLAYPVEETVAKMEAMDVPERAKALLRESIRNGRLPPVLKAPPTALPDPPEVN